VNDDAFTLTPLDIRKQEFRKSLRGYDTMGVEDFRVRVADALEQQLRQETRAAAEREGQVIVREAEAEAKRLLDEAKNAESAVQSRMAETERQFQQYVGGFRALLERHLAELRTLDGGGQRG
jgi:DivIVA domain-containing protein